MRSNNFIEIKINTKHVFLGRLPPTPHSSYLSPHTNTWDPPPQPTCLSHNSGPDRVWDTVWMTIRRGGKGQQPKTK